MTAGANGTLALRDGTPLPALGLGTWKSDPGKVGAAVRAAIESGYRHIDCAPVYGNEPEVGEALADAFAAGRIERDDIWITSKLWNDSHAPEDVRPAVERTLADLDLERLDLYLMHWPVAQRRGVTIPSSGRDLIALTEAPLAATWAAMVDCVRLGLVRHVGVSNFSLAKLEALADATDHPPEVNQIELHPFLQQNSLLDYCRGAGIVVTAYSPLGSPDRNPLTKAPDEPDVLADPVIAEIAAEIRATPAQVLIAWALDRGTAVIPKSVTPARIAENFAALALSLSRPQRRRIDALDRHRRLVTGRFFELPGSPYSYANLWDEPDPAPTTH